MGYEGFYKTLLVAMGNVVSAILMYALQVAWLCQRLIDQDYRQNHGSRLTPIMDNKAISNPVEIVSTSSDFAAAKNSHHRPKHSRQGSKGRRMEKYLMMESSRSQRSSENRKRRRHFHRTDDPSSSSVRRLNSSHPYLEGSDSLSTTAEYVNGLSHNLGLRRAFSDINISSTYSEFKKEFCDNNQNYLSSGNIDENAMTVTDQDFLRLIFTKGYVT